MDGDLGVYRIARALAEGTFFGRPLMGVVRTADDAANPYDTGPDDPLEEPLYCPVCYDQLRDVSGSMGRCPSCKDGVAGITMEEIELMDPAGETTWP